MIRNTVTMDREDIIRILAEKFDVETTKVKLYFVENVIEDDIRAEIELPNPLKDSKTVVYRETDANGNEVKTLVYPCRSDIRGPFNEV